MYACILIPRELSLVLTLHPNHMHVLEMSASVWSNTHLPPGTIFYPDEGEIRLDRIENRMVIHDEDIRRYYGCYDAILNISGQEVRHCNWVRFVKTTTAPDDANVISSKVRGQPFYQVIRPIKPNDEIIVLFHLLAERSLPHSRIQQGPFAPYSPNAGLPLSYSDLQASLLLRQTHESKPTIMTSTPVSTKMFNTDYRVQDSVAQRKSLKFGSASSSSSSSSSSFASPQFDSPNSNLHQRNIHPETSFPSPAYTNSSSLETTTSGNSSDLTILDASSQKVGTGQTNDIFDTKRHVTENSDEEMSEQTNQENDEKTVTSLEQTKEIEVDVVNETNVDDEKDDGKDDIDSESSLSDEEIIADESDDVSGTESGDRDQQSSQASGQERVQSPIDQISHRTTHLSSSEQNGEESSSDFYKSDGIMKTEAVPIEKTQQQIGELSAIRLVRDDNYPHACTATENRGGIQNLKTTEESTVPEDIKYSEVDGSSTTAEEQFSFKLEKSTTKLDLQSTEVLDLSLLKRCRERTWWPCDVCGKKFDRPSLLKRHTRTHTGEKPHVCDVCGKAFSTSSSLNTHRRIHSGEKPHQCKTCGKRFTASSNLYYHRMTHNKEKPHKCDLCSKSFPTPGDLRSHMYIHNGSWPFRCDVCSRGFSKQTNLKNHMMLHSGDKPHECVRCEKRFALLCNLRTHMKTHENSDSSDCTECLKCGVAMGTNDDLQEGTCKRCLYESRRITETLSTPLLPSSFGQQRHTDFSISSLTSTDSKTTRSEKHSTLGTSPTISDNVKAKAYSGFVNSTILTSQHHQMPAIYGQFYMSPHDQHKWLLPPPSQQFFASQFLPEMMKHSGPFHCGLTKPGDRQTPPSVVAKIDNINPAHSGIPAFLTPEMMSLRGGNVFQSAANLPAGFSLHRGAATWEAM